MKHTEWVSSTAVIESYYNSPITQSLYKMTSLSFLCALKIDQGTQQCVTQVDREANVRAVFGNGAQHYV